MMNGTPNRHTPRTARRRALRWPAVLGALLAFLAVGGLPVETLAVSPPPTRVSSVQQHPAPASRVAAAHADVARPSTSAARATDPRPSFRTTFARADDGQAGQSYSYTVRVHNDGGVPGAVRVTTILPPAFSNVRVMAPGFACTRQFSASGDEAGTLVTCTRNELASGSTAEVTVDANAPTAPGSYRLTAAAEERERAVEDEDGARAAVTIAVRG